MVEESALEVPRFEVLGALHNICGSDQFQHAPQLRHFLTFIVTRALEGDQKSIKAYTIGTEALGRSPDFDPEEDSIVRVEAVRLRRALEAYYESSANKGDVRIRLPVGHYIPKFERPDTSGESKAPTATDNLSWFMPTRWASGQLRKTLMRLQVGWLVLASIAIIAVSEFLFDIDYPLHATIDWVTETISGRSSAIKVSRAYVGVIVEVEPVATIGIPTMPTFSSDSLHQQMIGAFARFENVTIVTKASRRADSSSIPQQRTSPLVPDFRLSTTVRFYSDDTLSLLFVLTDQNNSGIIWTKSFNDLRVGDGPAKLAPPIIREVATKLLHPYGIIHSQARVIRGPMHDVDPRYRCWLTSFDYLRNFDPALYGRTRTCLENGLAADPTFVTGDVQLARVHLGIFQFGVGGQAGDQAALDQAVTLVMRAIALKPDSASAYLALMSIAFARGDFDTAMVAGEKANALNPYDTYTTEFIAVHLAFLGESQRWLEIIRQTSKEFTIGSLRLSFMLFLVAYTRDDLNTASRHAARMTNEVPLGNLARALLFAKTGNRSGAQQAYERLVALVPAWRDDPRGEFNRIIPIPALADRIAADLASAASEARH